jgi:hypothetical protein
MTRSEEVQWKEATVLLRPCSALFIEEVQNTSGTPCVYRFLCRDLNFFFPKPPETVWLRKAHSVYSGCNWIFLILLVHDSTADFPSPELIFILRWYLIFSKLSPSGLADIKTSSSLTLCPFHLPSGRKDFNKLCLHVIQKSLAHNCGIIHVALYIPLTLYIFLIAVTDCLLGT